jgi:hypothetical protein
MYTCPICGYERLAGEPTNHSICPCCGTEFDYDDAVKSHAQLRSEWIARGARWFSVATQPPAGWDWLDQLYRAGKIPVKLVGSEVAVNDAGPELYQTTGRFVYSVSAKAA